MTPIGKYSDGSRKKKVFDLFVNAKEGPDVAWGLGQKLGLKPNTLRSWFSSWRSVRPDDAKAKVAKAKAEPKKVAKVAAKAKVRTVKAKSKKAQLEAAA